MWLRSGARGVRACPSAHSGPRRLEGLERSPSRRHAPKGATMATERWNVSNAWFFYHKIGEARSGRPPFSQEGMAPQSFRAERRGTLVVPAAAGAHHTAVALRRALSNHLKTL
jgi:hypothetical protein